MKTKEGKWATCKEAAAMVGKEPGTIIRAAHAGNIRIDKRKRPFLVSVDDVKRFYRQDRKYRGGYKPKEDDGECEHVTGDWLCERMNGMSIYSLSASMGIGYHLIARDRSRGEKRIPEDRRVAYDKFFKKG